MAVAIDIPLPALSSGVLCSVPISFGEESMKAAESDIRQSRLETTQNSESNPCSTSSLVHLYEFMRRPSYNSTVNIINSDVANRQLYYVGSGMSSNFCNLYSELIPNEK